ncbi:MAG: YggS family pyridoxal phosphate-dependent enzyme [Gemmatimonadaceae bacterium]|nr:YggS family pyridoxal phosphate-dependent enzyme [Gemmatimonadaceae bacterium]NUS98873.1 YggS family pyridoxal phosphate-dependent enzyme [Gemmatimonadaceae bacterium]
MPFPDLADRLAEVRGRIADAARRGAGQQVTLVAVTKTHGAEAVRAVHALGARDVGENKVQEALPKMDEAAVPVRWHLIGHLQRNKAKAVERFALVHSIDSLRLADAVSNVGAALGRRIPVLVQVNVSGEETKGGFSPADLAAGVERIVAMKGLDVRGVMTMAPFDAPERTLRGVFTGARGALETLRGGGLPDARELSMGMSGDYEIAVEEGATIVRLGTVLFGARGT